MFDPLVAAHFNNPASLTDTLIHQITVDKIYDKLFLGKKDLVFLDIGANIGLVSLYAYDSCSRIVCVEPDPQTFQVLRATTVGYPKIECVNAALTPQDGKHEFFCNWENTTASSTVNTFGRRCEVDGLSLGSVLRVHQLEHIDVVKLDCEGAEGESLTFEELRDAKPIIKSYMAELHNCPRSTWQQKLGCLVSRLSDLGYTMDVSGMTIYAQAT